VFNKPVADVMGNYGLHLTGPKAIYAGPEAMAGWDCPSVDGVGRGYQSLAFYMDQYAVYTYLDDTSDAAFWSAEGVVDNGGLSATHTEQTSKYAMVGDRTFFMLGSGVWVNHFPGSRRSTYSGFDGTVAGYNTGYGDGHVSWHSGQDVDVTDFLADPYHSSWTGVFW
jgi:hypothetical protein